MDATITVKELLLVTVSLVVIAFGIQLIVVLRNLNGLIKKANQMVDDNQKSLREAISKLPEISENVEIISTKAKDIMVEVEPVIPEIVENVSCITDNVNDGMEIAVSTIETVGEDISDTIEAIKDSTVDTGTYIKLVGEIIKIIKQAISKEK